MAGEAAREELVEEGVAEAFGGGDDLLGALDGLVDGVEHGSDGSLLGEGEVGDGQFFGEEPGRHSLATGCAKHPGDGLPANRFRSDNLVDEPWISPSWSGGQDYQFGGAESDGASWERVHKGELPILRTGE